MYQRFSSLCHAFSTNLILTNIGISVLVSLAMWSAVPFRRLSLAQQSFLTFSWDTALHTLVGLDLADSMRKFEILHFFEIIFDHHWWPPLYGILLSPFFLVFGRSLDNASLISFLAYIAMPVTAWMVIQSIFRSLPVWTLCAVLLLFLRSPMLLEMSAWSMFEMLEGFLGLLGWLFFIYRSQARHARAAYLVGTLLYFTKYHYGVFLIATFFVFTMLEETSDRRQRLWHTLRPYLLSKTAKILGCTALFVIVVRVIAEWQGFEKAEIVYIPTIPNVLYAVLVIVTVLGLYHHVHLKPIWQELPPRLRDFWYCTLIPVTFWLLIPGNLRAWYRQTMMISQQKADFLQQIHTVYTIIRYEYLFTVPALLFFVTGFFLVLFACRKRKVVRGMLAYSIWPILLISLNKFPVEARFLGCLFPMLIATSICGWVHFLVMPTSRVFRLMASVMLVLIAIVHLYEDPLWNQTMQQRAKYRYQYLADETEFIAMLVAQFDGQSPITISLPEGMWVSPTVRLGLRLRHQDLSPQDIIVDNKSLKRLLKKNPRLDARGMVIGCEKSPENLRDLQDIFTGKRLQFSSGPKLPVTSSPTREMIFSKL